MKSWKWIVPGAALVLAATLVSCSEHKSALVPQAGSPRVSITATYDFLDQLQRYTAGDDPSRVIRIAYATSEASPFTPQAPFPVLYLLHDFGGDATFFDSYGLQAIVDDMYAKGEIGRMLIVTVDASSYFGGSYYRNSSTTGRYSDVITSLIDYVDQTFHVHSEAGSGARAIGGQGMGGYGAMRYAIDHPDMFSSLSASCAPLAFGDPTLGTGFWNPNDGMLAQMYAENGTGPGDPNLYSALRAGWEKPNTNVFFAMSAAFSPHPLNVFDSLGCKWVCVFPPGNCVIREWVCGLPFYSPKAVGPNTISFPSVVDTFDVGVDAVMNADGQVNDSLWALWHDSADVETVFKRTQQSNTDLWKNLKIYMEAGTQDQYGYLEQNRSFDVTLTAAGVPHTYVEFGPAGSIPASHSAQLASRLREIIKFHSDNLARADLAANK